MQKIKYFSFFLIFFSTFFIAQKKTAFEGKATYKVAFKSNKADKNFHLAEYILLFNKDQALFISGMQYLKDSLLADPNNKKEDLKNKFSKIEGYTIATDAKKKEVSYILYDGEQTLKYLEFPEIVWNLESDTKEINGLQSKMATTSLYGRKWVAWYAPDIPYYFGPQKFSGLPGLILEVHDDSNSYQFSVGSISLIKKEFSADLHTDAKILDKNDFLKATEKKNAKIDNPLELFP